MLFEQTHFHTKSRGSKKRRQTSDGLKLSWFQQRLKIRFWIPKIVKSMYQYYVPISMMLTSNQLVIIVEKYM